MDSLSGTWIRSSRRSGVFLVFGVRDGEREKHENGRNGWNNNFFLLEGDFWLDIFVVKGVEGWRVLFGDRYRSLRFIVPPEEKFILLGKYAYVYDGNFRKYDISWIEKKKKEKNQRSFDLPSKTNIFCQSSIATFI